MEQDPNVAGHETEIAATSRAISFNKPKNRANVRKRPVEDGTVPADNEEEIAVVKRSKQGKDDNLTFVTRREQKLEVGVEYEASKALPTQRDNLATGMLETETDFSNDARALREQVLKQAVEGAKDDKKYRGMNNYTDFRAGFRREHTVAAEKGTGSHGPLRANVYVRTSARFDYQPDICKDYKETGFCSYGDACKFMHDRGDYKSGWEQEREWDAEQKAKREAAMIRALANEDDDGGPSEQPLEEEDSLPFACFICRRPWAECDTDPVTTRCHHYFCQGCALKHNLKTGKCAACQTATHGIFNIANDVLKRMKKGKGK